MGNFSSYQNSVILHRDELAALKQLMKKLGIYSYEFKSTFTERYAIFRLVWVKLLQDMHIMFKMMNHEIFCQV